MFDDISDQEDGEVSPLSWGTSDTRPSIQHLIMPSMSKNNDSDSSDESSDDDNEAGAAVPLTNKIIFSSHIYAEENKALPPKNNHLPIDVKISTNDGITMGAREIITSPHAPQQQLPQASQSAKAVSQEKVKEESMEVSHQVSSSSTSLGIGWLSGAAGRLADLSSPRVPRSGHHASDENQLLPLLSLVGGGVSKPLLGRDTPAAISDARVKEEEEQLELNFHQIIDQGEIDLDLIDLDDVDPDSNRESRKKIDLLQGSEGGAKGLGDALDICDLDDLLARLLAQGGLKPEPGSNSNSNPSNLPPASSLFSDDEEEEGDSSLPLYQRKNKPLIDKEEIASYKKGGDVGRGKEVDKEVDRSPSSLPPHWRRNLAVLDSTPYHPPPSIPSPTLVTVTLPASSPSPLQTPPSTLPLQTQGVGFGSSPSLQPLPLSHRVLDLRSSIASKLAQDASARKKAEVGESDIKPSQAEAKGGRLTSGGGDGGEAGGGYSPSDEEEEEWAQSRKKLKNKSSRAGSSYPSPSASPHKALPLPPGPSSSAPPIASIAPKSSSSSLFISCSLDPNPQSNEERSTLPSSLPQMDPELLHRLAIRHANKLAAQKQQQQEEEAVSTLSTATLGATLRGLKQGSSSPLPLPVPPPRFSRPVPQALISEAGGSGRASISLIASSTSSSITVAPPPLVCVVGSDGLPFTPLGGTGPPPSGLNRDPIPSPSLSSSSMPDDQHVTFDQKGGSHHLPSSSLRGADHEGMEGKEEGPSLPVIPTRRTVHVDLRSSNSSSAAASSQMSSSILNGAAGTSSTGSTQDSQKKMIKPSLLPLGPLFDQEEDKEEQEDSLPMAIVSSKGSQGVKKVVLFQGQSVNVDEEGVHSFKPGMVLRVPQPLGEQLASGRGVGEEEGEKEEILTTHDMCV